MESILECKHIYKNFGNKTILKDVSFNIKSGDILAFIGPNGAGKTTTIKLLLGLQKLDKGSVVINGSSINEDFCNAIKKVGAIVESPDVYMYLTGYQNLKLVANMYNNISNDKIMEVVKYVGLESRIHDKVSKYSLGMRQRLGIARALLNEPNLLILDEPTNGLDPKGIKEIRDLLVKLSKDGMGILISSHNLKELESFCTKILIINDGKIIEESSVNEISKNDSKYIITVSSTDNLDIDGVTVRDKKTLIYSGTHEDIAKLIRKLVKLKVDIYEVRLEKVSLEEAFFAKTGGSKK